MRSLIVLVLLVFTALTSSSSAQSAPQWLDPYRANADKLIKAATADQFAWDRLAELTDTYGQRISGSENLNRAIAWAVETMKKDGLDNVHTERVMVPKWVRGAESLEITNPPHHVVPMIGLGGSVATPPEGIEAEVMVVANRDELANLVISDHRCLLVSMSDPPAEGWPDEVPVIPPHGLNLTSYLHLRFADIETKDHQETWDDVIPPYGKPARDIVMQKEDGKRLWGFILRKYDPPAEVIVLQDEGDGRASSLALAICDALGQPREPTIYCVGDTEAKLNGAKPVNEYVFHMTKTSRNMVMG